MFLMFSTFTAVFFYFKKFMLSFVLDWNNVFIITMIRLTTEHKTLGRRNRISLSDEDSIVWNKKKEIYINEK